MVHNIMHGILYILDSGTGWQDKNAIAEQFNPTWCCAAELDDALKKAREQRMIIESVRRIKRGKNEPIYAITLSGIEFIRNLTREHYRLKSLNERTEA